MDGSARDYEMLPNENVSDAESWLRGRVTLVARFLSRMSAFRLRGMMYMRIRLVRLDEAGFVSDIRRPYIPSLAVDDIEAPETWYRRHITRILEVFNKMLENDSGLVFDGVECVFLKLNVLENLDGAGFFKLPPKLSTSKSVINVISERACFKYAVLSILHYDDIAQGTRQRVSSYGHWENDLLFENIDVNNVSIKDMNTFQQQNKLKINIHLWDKGLKGIIYNSRSTLLLGYQVVNVLLVVNGNGDRHYCGITNISRLYRHIKSRSYQRHYCDRCIRSFKSKDVLEAHYEWCRRGKLQIEEMPKERDYSYVISGKELSPLKVIYADSECYIDPSDGYTHKPLAIAAYEVWHNDHKQRQESCRIMEWEGDQCIVNFLLKLDSLVKEQYHFMENLTRRGMVLSRSQQAQFDSATNCPRCGAEFGDNKAKKVRDHCHLSGEFRGTLCSGCNLRLRQRRRVLPVIFHNLKGYDMHLLIKEGVGRMKDWQLSVIAQTTEKFMSLRAKIPVDQYKDKDGKLKTVNFDLVFLDSFQFMPSSLCSLVGNLEVLPETRRNILRDYPSIDDGIITRKGVFPYSYVDSPNRLSETQLPPQSAFTNDLTKEPCSDVEYAHARLAWSDFQCHSLGDYMRRYLELDVYLLADVFEAFRKMSLKEDNLDPVHYVSLPGQSYDSAFKKTGARIHLLQDAEMYTTFERGIRGGLTFINKHLVESQVLPEVGTLPARKVHLAYIDQNNLYGSALSMPLPYADFEWLDEVEIRHFSDPSNIISLDVKGETGYLFDVDLDYPESLHDRTADFPLAPESGEVTEDMLSPYMKDFYARLSEVRGSSATFKSCRKLLLTQQHKTDYICHFAILRFYLKMGMVLKRVNRVIRFKQRRFLKPYIDYNSEKRAHASNAFEKDFYKLKNNCLFGKTMEDVRKRQDYRLVTDPQRFSKLADNPLFIDRDIITDDITGVKMMKNKVVLNKPIYIGQAVLDYSKLEMYKLFYKKLPKCPLIKKLELAGGDTDSFFLSITTDLGVELTDVFQSLGKYFDSSNYSEDNRVFSALNRAKLGCFKDECKGNTLKRMILLRPKMYSMEYDEDSLASINRAKGISRSVVKGYLPSDYLSAYEESKEIWCNMTVLRSRSHTIQTITLNKRGLSCWEDKRCWLSPNESVPYGHYSSGVPQTKRRRLEMPQYGDVEMADC